MRHLNNDHEGGITVSHPHHDQREPREGRIALSGATPRRWASNELSVALEMRDGTRSGDPR